MATGDIVSAATRRAFQESYVANCVLRDIAADFDDAGVDRAELSQAKSVSGERRQLVEQYYATVDWGSSTSVRRVLDAFETHLARLEARHSPALSWALPGAQTDPPINDEHAKLVKHLARDGVGHQDGHLILDVPHQDVLDGLARGEIRIDLKHIRVSANRIRNAIDDDPALAIGGAKELVEATCKAILKERGVEMSNGADLLKLSRKVAEALALVPEGVAEDKKGAEHIRKVLGSLATVVQGLAELRNLYGTGHGQEGGLQARHARLCAGAATTLATFLMESDKAK